MWVIRFLGDEGEIANYLAPVLSPGVFDNPVGLKSNCIYIEEEEKMNINPKTVNTKRWNVHLRSSFVVSNKQDSVVKFSFNALRIAENSKCQH